MMRISTKEREKAQEAMDEACAKLMELGCDSVQIVATAHLEADMFCRISQGKGNLFARYGAVGEWLKQQDNIGLAFEIKEAVDSMTPGNGEED